MMNAARFGITAWLAFLLLLSKSSGEAMLQFFNASWVEVTEKLPELAEAGYDSLWLPPPTKASGGLSVGYDCWDRFDLGSKAQGGGLRTRYGSEGELLELVRVAHRMGMRVYFDNVMNHNAFDIPGYNASTPKELYPGFVPEDFHLRRTADGAYRKWDNTRDWNDAWQVQHLGLSDLIDIATEPGATNFNHGVSEGDHQAKPDFVRHPNQPGYYCFAPTGFGQRHSAGEGDYVGFGEGNGITVGMIEDNPQFFSERVEHLLNRAARWQIDRTKADGFRLDAVKHTPADFFGATFGEDRDRSNYGYSGQIQEQFNLTRGFTDWGNHRDSVFDIGRGRDDAMLFGEHLGQPPGYQPYIDAGMRLIDNDLRTSLNKRLGNPAEGLEGFDQSGAGGFPASVAVMHAQSHDNDFAARRELQHALYFTRDGLSLIYTDGNRHAGVLGGSGVAFPRHSNTAFLGQWGDRRIPNLLNIQGSFGRGFQKARWSDADFIAYERIDKRENEGMSDAAGTTMLLMLNDNYASGQSRPLETSFPSLGGGGSENNRDTADEYLFQYARGYGSQTGFYRYASALGSVVVEKGSYFVFAPRTPEASTSWAAAGGSPLMFYQGGKEADRVEIVRKDGPDGDPSFNPYGLPDENTMDYSYRTSVPVVRAGEDFKLVFRADGSAENVLLKLDGGIDLNGTRPEGNVDPLFRDHPPAISNDVFLGYEQARFVGRHHAEKFAAVDTRRNRLGSAGAETYVTRVGLNAVSVVEGGGEGHDYSTEGGDHAAFLYHDPEGDVGGLGGDVLRQFEADGSKITLWAKPNGVGIGFRLFCYFTTDGSNPEGAAGIGIASTRVEELDYSHKEGGDDWWTTSFFLSDDLGKPLRYKLGILKEGAASVYPSGPESVAKKAGMVTTFEVEGIDPEKLRYAPHNDYGDQEDGLREGFHVVRGRAFLNRLGKASLYNTFVQTFYYDGERPMGLVVFPEDDTQILRGSEYGAVVRADASTKEVWYRISDADDQNDDAATGASNGNGAWAKAMEVGPSGALDASSGDYSREFRFNYVNIPASGTAELEVRLKELSSSDEQELSDEEGHYTTLLRQVQTSGPELKMVMAYPEADGATIGTEYVLKATFSKALAEGIDGGQVKEQFDVTYGRAAAWPEGSATLDPEAFWLVYDETEDEHALAFRLPDLFSGDSEELFRVRVGFDRALPFNDLTASRLVRAESTAGSRVAVSQPPAAGSDGRPLEIILPDGPGEDLLEYRVRVETDLQATAVTVEFTQGAGQVVALDAYPELPGIQPLVQGGVAIWEFVWMVTSKGEYRMLATSTTDAGNYSSSRAATVILRQLVDADGEDLDDDDDGLGDLAESDPAPLPNGFSAEDPRYQSDPDLWTNAEMHAHASHGRSNPLWADSDGDGLPDGLELGVRRPAAGTELASDTNGDGMINFAADLDPPFFNTSDNLGLIPGIEASAGSADRSRLAVGSMTLPGDPDSDDDGLLDGVEDSNANGWVDGDGEPLASDELPHLGRRIPNGRWDAGERWRESSPTVPDSDGDGLMDGFGEDVDFNGSIAGDLNGDRVWQVGESWGESDPLNADTDGDGLPDGWEKQNGLNALDNGERSLQGTAADMLNGAEGDPDGDGVDNETEWLLGMNPQSDDRSIYPMLELSSLEGRFELRFAGLERRVYQLESSSDMKDWSPEGEARTTERGEERQELLWSVNQEGFQRFYRLVVSAPAGG